MKKLIYGLVGLAVAAGVVSILSLNQPAEAARVRGSGSGTASNQADLRVINAFTRSIQSLLSDINRATEGETFTSSSFVTVEENNNTLQSHSFKKLDEGYASSATAIQQEAEKLTQAAAAINGKTLTDRVASYNQIDDGIEAYNAKLAKMTSAVENYNQARQERTEQNNAAFGKWALIVAGAIGALIAAGIIAVVVANNKAKKLLFGNDAFGAALPKEKKQLVMNIHTWLVNYDKAYQKLDQTGMKLARDNGYNKFETLGIHESLGKYRSLIYEFAAIIAYAHNNVDHAQKMLAQADSYQPATLYTATARQIKEGKPPAQSHTK